MTAVLALVMMAGAAHATNSKGTPVEKVIQLMEGMLEKGKKEKHEEMVQFASFKQFCDDTSVEKGKAVADANEQIETLKADIFQFTAEAERLSKEIAQLDEDISVWTGDLSAAKKVRAIEKA